MLRHAAALFCLTLAGLSQPVAQNAIVTIDGFDYSLRQNSIHTFVCKVESCGPQGVVSYQIQQARADRDLGRFEAEKRRAYAKLVETQAPGATLVIGKASRRTSGNAEIMQIAMEASIPGRPMHHRVSGYVFGKSRTFSLISSAGTSAAAKRNFDLFVLALSLQADLGI